MWRDHDAVFFSGGGLKVAAFLGVLEAADLSQCRDAYGVSAGAMLACLLAVGLTAAQVRARFFATPWSRILFDACAPERVMTGRAPIDGRAVRAVLEAWLAEAHVPADATFAWLAQHRAVRFACFAADVHAGRLTLFTAESHGDVRVVDAITAAMALPGFMDPVSIGGRLFMDAAVANNAPLSLLPPRRVLALVTSTGLGPKKSESSALAFWLRCSFLTRVELLAAGPNITVLELPLAPAGVHLFRSSVADLHVMHRQGRDTAAAHASKHTLAGLCVLAAWLLGHERAEPAAGVLRRGAALLRRGRAAAQAAVGALRELVGG